MNGSKEQGSNEKTFYLYTLGCKVNQYESQVLREGLQRAGFREAPKEKAAFSIINTCTVTGQSDIKSRRAIHRVISANARSRIVITGCGVEKHKKHFTNTSAVVFIGGNEFKDRLVSLITALERTPDTIREKSSLDKAGVPATCDELKGISSFGGRTRAFVKVQDGCNSRCSYCTIPDVRGRSRSRLLPEVCEEIRGLIRNGYHEIVLTGIHLGQYGDADGNTLPDLIRAVAQVPGLVRLRLSSLEPQDITDGFIEVFAGTPLIAPHLHLPLQNGDNRILKKMNRCYTIEDYSALVAKLRAVKPDLLLTTDLIVGFPDETEEYFNSSLSFVCATGFAKVHVFPFSSRPGTPAHSFLGKLPKKELKQRVAFAISKTVQRAYEIKTGFTGRQFDVLVESKKDTLTNEWMGFTPNYLKVSFPADGDIYNTLVPVVIKTINEDHVKGELVV